MTLSTILIGILPSVFFGVATTLMGKTGGSDRQRVMGAVLGGLLMAAVATPFLHPAWTPLNLGVSFLTGLLLGVGVCDQLRSYSVLGMSRTMPLSTGGQLVWRASRSRAAAAWPPRTRCVTAACSPRFLTASCRAPPSCCSSSTPTTWARARVSPSPSSESSSPRRWASCGSTRPARARNCAGPSSASPSSSWARSSRGSPRPSTSPERRGDYLNI